MQIAFLLAAYFVPTAAVFALLATFGPAIVTSLQTPGPVP